MKLVLPSSGYNCSKLKKQAVCCYILYFGWFPGVWILCADVSEHSVPSSQAGLLMSPVKMEQSVLKTRHIKSRRRGITHNKEYDIQITAKVGNQGSILLWKAGFYIPKYAGDNEKWRSLRIPLSACCFISLYFLNTNITQPKSAVTSEKLHLPAESLDDWRGKVSTGRRSGEGFNLPLYSSMRNNLNTEIYSASRM
jgi:hypothetical protein